MSEAERLRRVRELVAEASRLAQQEAHQTTDEQRMWLRLTALLWVARDVTNDLWDRTVASTDQVQSREKPGH